MYSTDQPCLPRLVFLDHLWLLIDQLHNQHIFILASLQEKKKKRQSEERSSVLEQVGNGAVRPPLFLTFTSATEHTHKKTHPSSNVSEHLPFIRIYKDGRVERLTGTEIISTSLDKTNDIVTKDVLYSPEHNISARLFLPHKATAGKNLPLLVYIHGGAWIIESPFSPIYHNYVTEIVKSANCLVVSIQYRRAPEDPVPASYEDS
uniref:Alpha/beta hydrolase fold-3 domain-containing protein n=1 Tax=Brassica oleracea var. oleracea TaxID=109376 RepID=A0A0D3BIK2_BRAOL